MLCFRQDAGPTAALHVLGQFRLRLRLPVPVLALVMAWEGGGVDALFTRFGENSTVRYFV